MMASLLMGQMTDTNEMKNAWGHQWDLIQTKKVIVTYSTRNTNDSSLKIYNMLTSTYFQRMKPNNKFEEKHKMCVFDSAIVKSHRSSWKLVESDKM